MAEFTKAQILQLIADNLPDNITKSILPEHLREVVIKLTDMLQGAEFISFDVDHQGQNFDNVNQALLYLLNVNIPTWVDADYLDQYVVYHEGALYRSSDAITQGSAAPDVNANWELVSGTGGDDMTPAEIVTALETLAINSALNATKVRYSTGVSVAGQIASMLASMAALQPKLYNSRFFVANASPSANFTISNQLLHPVNFFLNGKYYNGRQASNFNPPFSSYDYRYAHSGSDTIFYFNPLATGSPMFVNGDTLDLVHSSVAIGDPA